MTIEETLYEAFKSAYHQDHANAALHCAHVRYSPLTFRLAEAMRQYVHDANVQAELNDTSMDSVYPDVKMVLLDLGRYAEDRGR